MKYAKNRNLMDLARKILGKYSAVLLLLNGTVYIFK
jgi:hypothetical protein